MIDIDENNVCHVTQGADAWQFGDGTPGQRSASADYADISVGIAATLDRYPDALFKFHLTKHSLRLVVQFDSRVDIWEHLAADALTLDEARTAKFALTFTTGRDVSEVLANFEHTGYCIDEMESVHITPLVAE
jgi:hypothetical protein